MKDWWKSKTILFGMLVAVAGALEQFTEVLQGVDGVPGGVVSVIGGVVVLLRFVTREPVVPG